MGLFSQAQKEKILAEAKKSQEFLQEAPKVSATSIHEDLQKMTDSVLEYFKDSPAILISSKQQLHDYVTDLLDSEYAGIDTETTGLDRYKDHIVGASLYFPGGTECYIPSKHLVPIMDEPYSGQLEYDEIKEEFDRIKNSKTKLIFANADFDLAMIYNNLNVDLIDRCYYDVLIAWRCLKEDELHNNLKDLYNKYVLKGKGDPKRFSDFFTPTLFPYCKPEIAKLYAANDAKITYELFRWQLQYCTKSNPKCQKKHLEAISDLIWNLEFPMIAVCQNLFRTGIYVDQDVAKIIRDRYNAKLKVELEILQNQVQELIDTTVVTSSNKRPFATGKDFNPNSQPHAKYLLYDLLKIPEGKKSGTGKEIIAEVNLPVTNQILKVRSLKTLISTFTDKLWRTTTSDGRIHAQFKQIGAGTGRLSSANPNMQNIPSHATDIRHLFRATPKKTEVLNLQVKDEGLYIELHKFDKIVSSDQSVRVDELSAGSVVDVKIDNQVNQSTVLKISQNQESKLFEILLENTNSGTSYRIVVETPPYVMLSSDYSSQEPRLTAFLANDEKMIDAFVHDRDVYANIASVAFKVPYEECLEFNPITHAHQPEGKARRGEAKYILLGICYGRSVPSIAEQLYGTRTDMTEEEKVKEAQKVYDAVLNSFPGLRNLMVESEKFARRYGYVETILGRRRHLPDMTLPEFDFKPMRGYVNPDVDPLNVETLKNKDVIPERVVNSLRKEFSSYKYYGQIARRTKQLYEEDKIKVINNRQKINDASRQVLNSRIQGSAADLTKMAMLKLENDPEWKEIGGKMLVPVHDEIIAEVPAEFAEKGGEILSRCMVEAADFLPFPIKCDVETTYRWYGLDYQCPYTKPTDADTEDPEEVKWIQYHLVDLEFPLPVIKNEDGSKPIGDAASGINGVITEEYHTAIQNYMKKYRVSKENLIQDLDDRFQGVI